MKNFDAIIIGSGQAGTPLAFKLAAEGNKVAFIEKDKFGGTCVNDGCTPTKAYAASARRIWDARNGAALGIIIPDRASVDWCGTQTQHRFAEPSGCLNKNR